MQVEHCMIAEDEAQASSWAAAEPRAWTHPHRPQTARPRAALCRDPPPTHRAGAARRASPGENRASVRTLRRAHWPEFGTIGDVSAVLVDNPHRRPLWRARRTRATDRPRASACSSENPKHRPSAGLSPAVGLGAAAQAPGGAPGAATQPERACSRPSFPHARRRRRAARSRLPKTCRATTPTRFGSRPDRGTRFRHDLAVLTRDPASPPHTGVRTGGDSRLTATSASSARPSAGCGRPRAVMGPAFPGHA
jgi:hypothetical protein